MSASVIIILLAIAASIALGYFTKVNFGLYGIAFAFVLGCFVCGFSTGKVTNMWPTKVFFQMFSVTFFYAFAINNGTLELLARKIVYRVKKIPVLIPVVLWATGFVLAGIGPGSIAMYLCLAPLFFKIAEETNMHPTLCMLTMATGINTGAWSPIAVNGITTRNLIETAGYSAEEAAVYGNSVFVNLICFELVLFALSYIIFRGWKCKAATIEKPAEFNREQKISVTLIAIMLAITVIPAILKGITGNKAISSFAGKIDVTYLAIIFGILSIIFKVGDQKKALASVPWKTLIMVSGMGMLIEVASQAGALDYLSNYIGDTFSANAVPYVLCVVAAVMSFFSSTMGVVIPTLYPIIFAICASTGALPALCFSVVPIAATSLSPFSLAGGLGIANVAEEKKDQLFYHLIVVAIVLLFFVPLCVFLHIIH